LVVVGGQKVSDLASLWRAVWACGSAGARVPVTIAREATPRDFTIASIDRRSFLKPPRLH
jgi:hypothetical protein